MATEYEEGLLVGLLVGEGHFGGDGRQPQVTLRMHVRHEALFRWIERTFPGGRLYGPYEHGGRRYYQWMARGRYLRDELAPMLRRRLTPQVDAYASQRLQAMLDRFQRQLAAPTPSHVLADGGGTSTAPPITSGAPRTADPASAEPNTPEPADNTPEVDHETPSGGRSDATSYVSRDPEAIFRALRGHTS